MAGRARPLPGSLQRLGQCTAGVLYSPQEVLISWSKIPNIARVSYTRYIPQHHVGKYAGATVGLHIPVCLISLFVHLCVPPTMLPNRVCTINCCWLEVVKVAYHQLHSDTSGKHRKLHRSSGLPLTAGRAQWNPRRPGFMRSKVFCCPPFGSEHSSVQGLIPVKMTSDELRWAAESDSNPKPSESWSKLLYRGMLQCGYGFPSGV